jgi:hypothetical protein
MAKAEGYDMTSQQYTRQIVRIIKASIPILNRKY